MTNEVFQWHSTILNGTLKLMFLHCWNFGCMPQAWKVGLIKLVPKMELHLSDGDLFLGNSITKGCMRYLQRVSQHKNA